MISFIVVYVFCLTVPGWALLYACNYNPRREWYLYPITSLFYFLALILLFRLLHVPFNYFSGLYFGLLVPLLILNLYRLKQRAEGRRISFSWSMDKFSWIMPVLVMVLALYAVVVGPYTEVPSDSLWHISKIRQFTLFWSQVPQAWERPLWDIVSQSNYYWYHFCAWLLVLTGMEFESGLSAIWTINFVLFCMSFHAFARTVFADSPFRSCQIQIAALISVFFLIFHFGIGPFSFVRYYVFAPAYLALTGFWSVLIVCCQFLKGQIPFHKTLLLSSLLGLTTLMLHHQEALYIAVMLTLLVGTLFLRDLRTALMQPRLASPVKVLWQTPDSRKILVCLLVLIAGYLCVHGWLYLYKARSFALDGGFIIPLAQLLPFFNHLFVLDPAGQFFQVLTIWGVWAYVVYFLFSKRGQLPPIITAGLFVPVWTIFNPVFVDLFLRISWPEVLWRLCYLIPLELWMAWMVVYWGTTIFQTKYLSRKAGYGILCLMTVILLFRFDTGFVFNHYSKVEMLKPVAQGSDYRYLQDVTEALNRFPANKVLSDRVTGYVINAYTDHQYNGHKFYGLGATSTTQKEYHLKDFSDYNRGLLVVNRRTGDLSYIGAIGKHWPDDIRHHEKAYSDSFLQFVDRHPQQFLLEKELEGVSIYSINTDI